MRVARIVVMALLGSALAGCGASAGGVAGDVEGMDGVRAASIERIALDDDYFSSNLVADMEQDASVAEIAAVLDRTADWQAKATDDDKTVTLRRGAGSTKYMAGPDFPGAHSMIRLARDAKTNKANAELFVAAQEAFDDVIVIEETGWTVYTPKPRDLAKKVLADDVLTAAPALSIEPDFDATGNTDPDVPWLGSGGPLTRDLLVTFDRAVAAAEPVNGQRLMVSTFHGRAEEIDENGKVIDRAGQLDLSITFPLPKGGGLKSLAKNPNDDPRWPTVKRLINLLRQYPEGSQLLVWVSYPGLEPGGDVRQVLGVTWGVGPTGGELRTWELHAAAYLGES